MKWLWNFFLSLSKSYQISLVVLVLHCFLLFWGIANHLLTKKTVRHQAMIVRTVTPNIKIANTGSSPPIIKPQKKITSIEKKQSTPPAKKENPARIFKKETPSLDRELLNELVHSLEAIQPQQIKKRAPSPLSLPQQLAVKTEIENFNEKNGSYAENLIALFTRHLNLPEFGSVKAAIQIDARGTLLKFTVLEEKSRKNSEFLKNRLHELTFPCFNEFGLSENQLEFIITFCNQELER